MSDRELDELEKEHMKEGFNITCNSCGKDESYEVYGVTGYGVELACVCGNRENLYW